MTISKAERNGSGNCLAIAIAVGALLSGAGYAWAQTEGALALDNPTEVAGIEVVCTGVGLDAREDPRWSAYSLKVELAGKGGQYLGDVGVNVTKNKEPVLTTVCGGPWLLFKLPPARYQVDATIENKTVSATANVPARGQGRIILRFPELGGALEQPAAPAPENKAP